MLFWNHPTVFSLSAVALQRLPAQSPARHMPSRLPRTASRLPSRKITPSGLAKASARDGLQEARENLEYGGSAIMAMTYMGQLGVTLSRETLASEAQEMEEEGEPGDEAIQGFHVRWLFHEIAAQTATTAVDSAAILYAHAVLSGVIDALCELSMSLDPDAWATDGPEPEKPRGPLPPLVIPKAPPSWFEQSSLYQKCEALLTVNRRGALREVLPDFKYSAEHIRQLDHLRQRLVEQTSFDRKTLQAEEKVAYLLKTAQFFINLLARRQAEGPRKRTRRAPQKSDPEAEPVWVQDELL